MRQFLLRLDPEDPEDALLIEALDKARAQRYGGVQRFLRRAVSAAVEQGIAVGEALENTDAPVSQALLDALGKVLPQSPPEVHSTIARSTPLRAARMLFAALDTLSPETMSELDALLLREAVNKINEVLDAAAHRRPIREKLEEQ